MRQPLSLRRVLLGRGVHPHSRPQRGRWALVVAALATAALAAGCARRGGRRVGPPRYVGQVADGRPDLCPARAVDPFGDGTPAPDDARCSYAHAGGGQLVELRGQVLTEPRAAAPGDPVEGASVVVTAVQPGGGRGGVVAKGKADAQGSFTIGAMLPPGRYRVALAGAPATAREVVVDARGVTESSIVVIVPSSVAAPR